MVIVCNCGTVRNHLEVTKCPLNGQVEELFRILIDARFVSHISAFGCNLTGTLKDLSSLRQRSFRLGTPEFKKHQETGLKGLHNVDVLRVVQNIDQHSIFYIITICSLMLHISLAVEI